MRGPGRRYNQSNVRDLPRSQRDHGDAPGRVGRDAPADVRDVREPVLGARVRSESAPGPRRRPRTDRGAARRAPRRGNVHERCDRGEQPRGARAPPGAGGRFAPRTPVRCGTAAAPRSDRHRGRMAPCRRSRGDCLAPAAHRHRISVRDAREPRNRGGATGSRDRGNAPEGHEAPLRRGSGCGETRHRLPRTRSDHSHRERTQVRRPEGCRRAAHEARHEPAPAHLRRAPASRPAPGHGAGCARGRDGDRA